MGSNFEIDFSIPEFWPYVIKPIFSYSNFNIESVIRVCAEKSLIISNN